MTDAPERFRFLASHVAGRPVSVAAAPTGTAAHTDGFTVFVSPGADSDRRRREVLLQSALIGADSFTPTALQALRRRPSLARRYLMIEGQRALSGLRGRVPLVDGIHDHGAPPSTTPEESLRIARSRQSVPEPPAWFGTIIPARLVAHSAAVGARAEAVDLDVADSDADDGASGERSRILKLFEVPIAVSETIAELFRTLLGAGHASDADDAGDGVQARALRRAHELSPNIRPLPTPITFTSEAPGVGVGVGGGWYPEWDVHAGRYRPDWCRVVDYPLTPGAHISPLATARDETLRRRLSRIGVAPRLLRRRSDGEDLDIEALVDLFVDLRSGHSSPEHVYTERRSVDRELGVLILIDASGSATDTDPRGLAVHDHQRRAAATIAATLEDLGDRVAVYGFHSHGRSAVHLPAIKSFDQPFGAAGHATLSLLKPSGYTRLGAGIRGAGAILTAESGTPKRLLLVLSDGFPYDHGYDGRYAEADTSKALEELRSDGVACLCLSLGGAPDDSTLERVFGTVGHASAAALGDLSPRMDELFATALAELAAPAIIG